jgi:hypothetical protein
LTSYQRRTLPGSDGFFPSVCVGGSYHKQTGSQTGKYHHSSKKSQVRVPIADNDIERKHGCAQYSFPLLFLEKGGLNGRLFY